MGIAKMSNDSVSRGTAHVPMAAAVEPTMGFIMIEAGLENIAVKTAFRVFPPKKEEKEKDPAEETRLEGQEEEEEDGKRKSVQSAEDVRSVKSVDSSPQTKSET